MPKPRKENNLEVRKRVLIVCEGQRTEPEYFLNLVRDRVLFEGLSAVQVVIPEVDRNDPIGLMNEARTRLDRERKGGNPFDHVWVVFDRDGHAKISQALNMADATIKIAFSVPCFEYWLLLHFERTDSPFAKCDDAIERLRTHFPAVTKGGKVAYEMTRDKIDVAIKNAKMIENAWKRDDKVLHEQNPISTVHYLIDLLKELSDQSS